MKEKSWPLTLTSRPLYYLLLYYCTFWTFKQGYLSMKFEGQKLQYDFPKMREGAVKRRLELFQKIIRFGTLARHLAVKRSKQFRLCSKLVEFPRICWVVLLCMWVWAVWVAAEPVATLQQLQSAVWTSVNLSSTSTIIPNSCAACASMLFLNI